MFKNYINCPAILVVSLPTKYISFNLSFPMVFFFVANSCVNSQPFCLTVIYPDQLVTTVCVGFF